MATDNGLLACWALIQAAGIPRPWPGKPEADQALSAWALVLADTSDDRLLTLTTAWLRSSEARFHRWPMPGALLHALPDRDLVDDADDAWGEALRILQWRGAARAPSTPADLEDLRGRLRAAYALAREAGDQDRMQRVEHQGRMLPREDPHRSAALFAGVFACGGWRALGLAEDDAMVAHRASFRSAYRSHRQRRQLTATELQVAALLEDHVTPRLAGP
jgi:hypothetical protein